jgi:hypothetical protein
MVDVLCLDWVAEGGSGSANLVALGMDAGSSRATLRAKNKRQFPKPLHGPVAISCGTWDHDAFDQRELPIDLPACEEISHFYA